MERSKLKVGDKLTLYVRDDVGTENDKIDSDAVVEKITEDGTILVRAKDYKWYKNDGSNTTDAVDGGESKLFNLDYRETGGRIWKLQKELPTELNEVEVPAPEVSDEVENETVED